MKTRKINKIHNRGGGFFDIFRSKKNDTITAQASSPAPVTIPVTPITPPPVKNAILKKTVIKSDKIAEPLLTGIDVVEKIDDKTALISKIGNISSNLSVVINPLQSVVHHVTEIIKIHPIGHLLVGTLLFVKKLKELYRNHQQIVEFLIQVETIVENSYRLNELIDKINEMMVIYTFNNEEYKNKYKELFELEKEILNNKDSNALIQLGSKEKELFDGLLETANNNKKIYRSNLTRIEFDNLDKFIEPNKLIKEQLTVRIAEINKYLLTIATNDMLKTLKNDMNINKSGLIRLVLDEIKSREKRFKWLRDRKRDWDRVNSRGSIMRKLNDDLIMMNSLFILVKFQMDFTLEYYKNQNISQEEWNSLWRLMTSFKEYTSYMIPNEVFMTIKTINAIIESEIVESKNAVMALGDVINELNKEDEESIEMKPLNDTSENSAENSTVMADEVSEDNAITETQLGGKHKTRKNNRRNLKNKNRYIKNKKSYKKKNNKKL